MMRRRRSLPLPHHLTALPGFVWLALCILCVAAVLRVPLFHQVWRFEARLVDRTFEGTVSYPFQGRAPDDEI